MKRIGAWIHQILQAPDDVELGARVRDRVRELCEGFPLYEDWLAERLADGSGSRGVA